MGDSGEKKKHEGVLYGFERRKSFPSRFFPQNFYIKLFLQL